MLIDMNSTSVRAVAPKNDAHKRVLGRAEALKAAKMRRMQRVGTLMQAMNGMCGSDALCCSSCKDSPKGGNDALDKKMKKVERAFEEEKGLLEAARDEMKTAAFLDRMEERRMGDDGYPYPENARRENVFTPL